MSKEKELFSDPRWKDPPAYEVVSEDDIPEDERLSKSNEFREKLQARGIKLTE